MVSLCVERVGPFLLVSHLSLRCSGGVTSPQPRQRRLQVPASFAGLAAGNPPGQSVHGYEHVGQKRTNRRRGSGGCPPTRQRSSAGVPRAARLAAKAAQPVIDGRTCARMLLANARLESVDQAVRPLLARRLFCWAAAWIGVRRRKTASITARATVAVSRGHER